MPTAGKNSPKETNFSCREGEIRPIKPQIPQKLLIPSRSQAWTIFEGSLPRVSLRDQHTLIWVKQVHRLTAIANDGSSKTDSRLPPTRAAPTCGDISPACTSR